MSKENPYCIDCLCGKYRILTLIIALVFAIIARAPIALGESADHSPLHNLCSKDILDQAIQVADDFKHRANKKSSTGSLGRGAARSKLIQLSKTRSGADTLFSALEEMSAAHDTKALVFYNLDAQHQCSWLVSRSGIQAAGVLASPPISKMPDILADLSVSTRRHAGSVPTQNVKRDTESMLLALDAELAASAAMSQAAKLQDHAQVDAALESAAKTYLPTSVQTALYSSATSGSRLLIFPTSYLREVPFMAFRVRDKYLIDLYSIIVFDDIEPIAEGNWSRDLVGARKRGATILSERFWNWRLPSPISQRLKETTSDANKSNITPSPEPPAMASLIVGDPNLHPNSSYTFGPLPGASDEANYIGRKLKSTALLGSAATFDRVESLMLANRQTLQLIYFATHGHSDSFNPATKSYLALAGRPLYLTDIQNIRNYYKTDGFTSDPLVVMSACQTGLGRRFAEGVFGLADGWRYAGASQVIMSLWDVDSNGTSALMKRLADELMVTDGAEYALANAIRKYKKENSDPAVWAAFTVFGKPTANP